MYLHHSLHLGGKGVRARVGGGRVTIKELCILNGGKGYCPDPQSAQTGNVHPCHWVYTCMARGERKTSIYIVLVLITRREQRG